MEKRKITVVENEEVCFQLEYYLLKSGKESCGIEAVKTEHGEILETQTVFLDGHTADDICRWIMRLADAFVTPAVLEEMFREVIILDALESRAASFPLCS
ncbi:MAG: hypothetical protein HFE85_04490 [Clostridiales bacterium]|nr:hypothetical protein [Clostridiales bacterium]